MDNHEYLTLAGPGHAQTRVLGSRFLGTADFLEDAEGISALLEEEKKRYHDATHWCFAFRVGIGAQLSERGSDAGEPKGTAGIPILREIQKRELTNCFVIITRYFGGTKLGTGGLARAYGECAALALDEAPVLHEHILAVCRIKCPFDDQGIVYNIANRFHATVEPQPEAANAAFILRMSPDVVTNLTRLLTDESHGRIRVSEGAA